MIELLRGLFGRQPIKAYKVPGAANLDMRLIAMHLMSATQPRSGLE